MELLEKAKDRKIEQHRERENNDASWSNAALFAERQRETKRGRREKVEKRAGDL